MPLPTKPFGNPGLRTGAMLGGGNRRLAPMTPAASDGLSALKARLAGAKKNKAMKPAKQRNRTRADFAENQAAQT